MEKFDRIYQLNRIFNSRRTPISVSDLADKLNCSQQSIGRAIKCLQYELIAPLDYDTAKKGWYYAEGEKFELPGLWMTAQELQSLVMLLNTLQHFGRGVLSSEFTPIEQKIHKLLLARNIDPQRLGEQFRILPFAHKPFATKTFKTVGEALIAEKQLNITYTDFNNKKTRRTISPQNIIYYRDNWYLDAWCHTRKALRTFALPRINKIILLKERAKKIPLQERDAHFSQSYGMFAGQPKRTARLRFLPRIARDIAQQQWHPDQKGKWDNDEYLLEIPYSQNKELIGDILRHMPDVIVEAPGSLRSELKKRLWAGLGAYD